MSNRPSVFDVVAIVATTPVSWRFVAKRELRWIPLLGQVLRVREAIAAGYDPGQQELS
jgi:1-acyl-sn-glycerol-3-phosphate acyltransferase